MDRRDGPGQWQDVSPPFAPRERERGTSARARGLLRHPNAPALQEPATHGLTPLSPDRPLFLLPAASPRSYYHNAATGATSWEVPAGYGGGVSASTRKAAVTKRSGGKKKAQVFTSVAEKLAARAKKFVGLRKADKAKSQPSAFARKRGGGAGLVKVAPVAVAAAAAAPAAAEASPWTEATHPETGQKYYYNATTGETSWTAPA